MLFEKGLIGSHYIHLVIISVIVAIFASYSAISLVSRITGSATRDKWLLLASSVLMGGGIWTMHFIGMLSFHLGIPIVYNLGLVILSFILAAVSSIISFWFVVRITQKKKHYLFLSSVVMGLGIAGMHYTGMESMEIEVEVTYDPIVFTISIAIAVLVSGIALHVFSKYRNGKLSGKIGSSIFLGLAVSSMHYTGMGAAEFTSDIHNHDVPSDMYFGTNTTLAIASVLFVFSTLVVILIILMMDERYASKLKESEGKYRQLVELSPMGIVIHKFGTLTYVNPAGMKILGAHTLEELIGRNVLDFIHPDYHKLVRTRWGMILDQNEVMDLLEEKLIRLDKRVIDVEIKTIPIISDGERVVQTFFRDITDRKRAEQLVYQLAYHDTLTELPNRRLFLDRLNQTLIDIKSSHRTLAVMFIDLDGFKRVNDTLGHDAGDLLLINVAKRLISCVRKEDTVSRLAGDEFVVLLPYIQQRDAELVAQRVIDALREPIIIDSNEVVVTPSIGISFSHYGNEEVEVLLKQADTAMYQAKEYGKNNYQIYTKS